MIDQYIIRKFEAVFLFKKVITDTKNTHIIAKLIVSLICSECKSPIFVYSKKFLLIIKRYFLLIIIYTNLYNLYSLYIYLYIPKHIILQHLDNPVGSYINTDVEIIINIIIIIITV